MKTHKPSKLPGKLAARGLKIFLRLTRSELLGTFCASSVLSLLVSFLCTGVVASVLSFVAVGWLAAAGVTVAFFLVEGVRLKGEELAMYRRMFSYLRDPSLLLVGAFRGNEKNLKIIRRAAVERLLSGAIRQESSYYDAIKHHLIEENVLKLIAGGLDESTPFMKIAYVSMKKESTNAYVRLLQTQAAERKRYQENDPFITLEKEFDELAKLCESSDLPRLKKELRELKSDYAHISNRRRSIYGPRIRHQLQKEKKRLLGEASELVEVMIEKARKKDEPDEVLTQVQSYLKGVEDIKLNSHYRCAEEENFQTL